MRKLENQTAVITGGSRGIGMAIVRAFVDEGARGLTCGRGSRPESLPDSVLWQSTDVSNIESVKALVERVAKEFSNPTILVNNAGVQVEKAITEASDQDWDYLMGINAKGVFLVCRALIPHMNSGGAIINIGSLSGNVADPSMALYNASKAFVHGLTRSIAVDHGPAIRCNAISPGWIATGMVEDAFAMADNAEAAVTDALQRHAVKRFGRPEDVANLAVWLASEDASFSTGQCYTLDGGLTSASPLNPSLF